MNFIWVAIGGALGAISRYGIQLAIPKPWLGFNWGTTIANLFGCLLVGFFAATFVGEKNQSWKLFIVTGFCGGFTTFSSFALEQKGLINHSISSAAIIHFLTNNILGIFFVVLGYLMASKLVVK